MQKKIFFISLILASSTTSKSAFFLDEQLTAVLTFFNKKLIAMLETKTRSLKIEGNFSLNFKFPSFSFTPQPVNLYCAISMEDIKKSFFLLQETFLPLFFLISCNKREAFHVAKIVPFSFFPLKLILLISRFANAASQIYDATNWKLLKKIHQIFEKKMKVDKAHCILIRDKFVWIKLQGKKGKKLFHYRWSLMRNSFFIVFKKGSGNALVVECFRWERKSFEKHFIEKLKALKSFLNNSKCWKLFEQLDNLKRFQKLLLNDLSF